MDAILEKIEKVVDQYIADFQSNPVKTGLKLILFYWIVKFIWKDVKSWTR